MSTLTDFWADVDAALDAIEALPATNAEQVIETLHAYDGEPGVGSGDAFFHGSGGDRCLMSALTSAGWQITWAEASYYYVATHPASGDSLTYIEGDVYEGDKH